MEVAPNVHSLSLQLCFHQVGDVNCSGVYRRHGNFHLGLLPEKEDFLHACYFNKKKFAIF